MLCRSGQGFRGSVGGDLRLRVHRSVQAEETCRLGRLTAGVRVSQASRDSVQKQTSQRLFAFFIHRLPPEVQGLLLLSTPRNTFCFSVYYSVLLHRFYSVLLHDSFFQLTAWIIGQSIPRSSRQAI